MCKMFTLIYVKVLSVLLDLVNARPRTTSGIQRFCSLHIALEKAKMVLQHCAECSKIYLAITGNSVVLKFEKARSVLEDGLRRVEDIVPTNYKIEIRLEKTIGENTGCSLNKPKSGIEAEDNKGGPCYTMKMYTALLILFEVKDVMSFII
ncbi:U-box domain-containing protein 6-like isoform X2 [Rutidosis leptorrhynchoides]